MGSACAVLVNTHGSRLPISILPAELIKDFHPLSVSSPRGLLVTSLIGPTEAKEMQSRADSSTRSRSPSHYAALAPFGLDC